MPQVNFHWLNKNIGEKLLSNQPFSVVRIDNTAGYVIDCRLRDEYPNSDHFNERNLIEGGIYPHVLQYAYDIVIPKTIETIDNADYVGFVDCAEQLQKSKTIIDRYKDKPTFFSHSFLIMDPGALMGLDHVWGELQDPPWTSYLKNKKVLVISTHRESILHQWKNIDRIWGENKDKIAPFELVDVIRSPYHPALDDRQYPGCNHWLDSVEYIKKQIETYEFDVLLSGATASSPIYVEHAKKLGKVGIQTGGTIQLFFGVYGYRWTQNNGYRNWQKMYNEHWMYPLEIDGSQQRKNHMYLETNYAYW